MKNGHTSERRKGTLEMARDAGSGIEHQYYTKLLTNTARNGASSPWNSGRFSEFSYGFSS